MKQQPLFLLFFLTPFLSFGQTEARPHLYMMPGFGADSRVFSKLTIENADTVGLTYLVPEKSETLPQYARRMAQQIDTTRPFYILGVSFGGMVAVEMSKFLKPEQIIIVASCKTTDEMPLRYRFQQKIPIYKWVSGRMMIRSAPIVAYFFERDMRTNMAFFKTMIAAKNPDFMKRAFIQIMSWQNTSYPKNLIHLHGSKDHTLPIRYIKNAQTLAGAGHWAIYVNAETISKVINQAIQ